MHSLYHDRGGIVEERLPRMRESAVRHPVGTDLIFETGSVEYRSIFVTLHQMDEKF